MCDLKVKGECIWTAEKLGMQQVIRRDWGEIKQVEAIMLSKISNTTTAVVRMDKSFVVIMNGVISYAGAFDPQYGG